MAGLLPALNVAENFVLRPEQNLVEVPLVRHLGQLARVRGRNNDQQYAQCQKQYDEDGVRVQGRRRYILDVQQGLFDAHVVGGQFEGVPQVYL